MKTKKTNQNKINFDYDIYFLQKRINFLIKFEEYERCAKIKSWIDELKNKK